MKSFIFCLVCSLLIMPGCTPEAVPGTGKTEPVGPGALISKTEISYAFGVSIGSYFKDKAITIDYNSFLDGMKDMLERNSPAMSLEEVNQKINTYITMMNEQKAKDDLEKEKIFFEKNKIKPGIITTASGLQYEILKADTGRKPKITDLVKIYYAGTLLSGTEFDSNLQQPEPATYSLYSVVEGWREGLQLMPQGSKFRFYIPSALGYGQAGYPPAVPPNATLVYEIELAEVIARAGSD